jgi:hypothetical protein
MVGACNTHGETRNHTKFGLGRDHSEYIGVDGRIIFKWSLGKIGFRDVDRINLVRNRDRWRAILNTAIKLRVP